MKKKNVIVRLLLVILAVVLNFGIVKIKPDYTTEHIEVWMTVRADEAFVSSLYYLTTGDRAKAGVKTEEEISKKSFLKKQVALASYDKHGKKLDMGYGLPVDTKDLCWKPTDRSNVAVTLMSLQIRCQGQVIADLPLEEKTFRKPEGLEMEKTGDGLTFRAVSRNNSVLLPAVDDGKVMEQLKNTLDPKQMRLNIALLILTDLLFLLLLLKLEKIVEIPMVILKNRSLVFSLGKNDFKTKFAGSMFGTIWAFVQPIVTVLVYWFVFEKALHVGTQSTKAGIAVPYLLWLLGGLVPWFFFSDALSTGTNVMMDYSYLVKKVVFNISCLPLVKVLSAFFVHLFFIAFTVLIYAVHGYYPEPGMLQCLYYTFGMVVLASGLIYFTSALVVFFRDLSQIVNIAIQVGVWFTPIMWNIDAMNIQGPVLLLLKMNPMYYVVMGYRDSFINHVWFWERPMETIYFWVITLLLFVFGTQIFRRLRIHFADVL